MSLVALALVFVCLRWQHVKRVIAQGLGLGPELAQGLGLGVEEGAGQGQGLEEGLGPRSVENEEREGRGDAEGGNGQGQGLVQGLELGSAQGPGLGKEGTIAYVGTRGMGIGKGKEGRMLLPSDEAEEEQEEEG